uniref:PSI domain-containing protein n=1 Tax=Glossina pallidipes TaxID=7398 RepID=A0A1A9Z3V8_GLOPL
ITYYCYYYYFYFYFSILAAANINTHYQSVQENVTNIKAPEHQSNSAETKVSETPIVVDYHNNNNQPLLGANGTGQRQDVDHKMHPAAIGTVLSDPIKSVNITNEPADAKKINQPIQKGVTNNTTPATLVTPTNFELNVAEEDKIIDTIDVPENDTIKILNQHNLTVNFTTDHHNYYNSTTFVDPVEANKTWNLIKNITPSLMLSQSHRRAMTVQLSFDFPFYGYAVRNVTVATGGFIYTGDYVHSWLAATQYIAPLMANFDTSLSNESYVRLNDTGNSFTVIWENVYLQDKQNVGKFTFSVVLHKNGDIVFTYFSVPISVVSIQDDKHPVKVGLSDAYIIDKVVYFARRKTIYEYHRVSFADSKIVNSTIIRLKALPTCLQYTNCDSCLNHDTTFDVSIINIGNNNDNNNNNNNNNNNHNNNDNFKTTFQCIWCPVLNRCSTGTDRKKQEWQNRGCDRSQVTDFKSCPSAHSEDNYPPGSPGSPSSSSSNTADIHHKEGQIHPFKPYQPNRIESSSMMTPSEPDLSPVSKEIKSVLEEPAESKNISFTLAFFVPICLVAFVLLWVLYAYRNPHTKSGQLLIQYRPSQWSWRRGEARYTAATIHM